VSSSSIRNSFLDLASKKIIIFDGAMGAMIQSYKKSSNENLNEADYRGELFKDNKNPLKGCGEVLCLTRPDIILDIHEKYLKAGADILETCSFNATSVSLAEFGLEDRAYELSFASASLARKAAEKFSTPERVYIAGSMGPTSKSASFSPDMNDPLKRAISWDELHNAYYDNARGLLDGGTDIFLIETVIDPINAKAAISAVLRLSKEKGRDLPIILSASILKAGGRLLSGQSLDAFFVSTLHAKALAFGLNCSFGADLMKAPMAELANNDVFSSMLLCAYPNAGLPNPAGGYDDDPAIMADKMEEYFKEGILNIAGGCCGSTPEHIAAIAERALKYKPHNFSHGDNSLPVGLYCGNDVIKLSDEKINFHKKESIKKHALQEDFPKLANDGEYEDAVDILRENTESSDELLCLNIDNIRREALADIVNYALQFPDLARLPLMLYARAFDNDAQQTVCEKIEDCLKFLPGRGIVVVDNFNKSNPQWKEFAERIGFFGAELVEG